MLSGKKKTQGGNQMKLKAKCPHCQSGCDKCTDGFTTVEFPEGDWYTRHCTNPLCGFDNGGCQGAYLYEGLEPCLMCQHHETVWVPLCESLGNPPWQTHQTDKPFARYLMALRTTRNKTEGG